MLAAFARVEAFWARAFMFVLSSSDSLSPLTSHLSPQRASDASHHAPFLQLLFGSLLPLRFHPLQSRSVRSLLRSVPSLPSSRSTPRLLHITQVEPTSPLWPEMLVAGNAHATTTNRTINFLAREEGQHCLLSQMLKAGGLVASGLRRLLSNPPHATSAIARPLLSLKMMMRVTATRFPLLSRVPVLLAEPQELLTSTMAAWVCHGPRRFITVESTR